MKNIILASGGTGGHIFPAESLAAELKARGYNPVLITDKRYQNYKSDCVNLETHIINTGTFGSGLINKFKAGASIISGYFEARSLLKKYKPEVVIGFGGYPSFPTMYAAVNSGYKTILHEQNSMLGRTNDFLAGKVDRIATSFDDVSGLEEDDMGKVVLTGNPVRPAIKTLREMPYPSLQENGMLRILVTGGSQGASIFYQVIPEAMALLPADLRKRIRIDQQCRAADIDAARGLYDKIGVSADLATFFSDIPSRLASSHLLIARSGASTLAELSVAGRPAILVPYPHAKDDHQTVNANALEDAGGGWLMPEGAFSAEALAAKLESFLNLPDTLKDAAEKSKQAGRVDADKQLADLVEDLIGKKSDSEKKSNNVVAECDMDKKEISSLVDVSELKRA